MDTSGSKQPRLVSELEVRRARLRLSAEALARETVELSPWRVRNIERAPGRARVVDVALLDETLQRLERAAGGGPDFHEALSVAVEPG